MQDKRCLTFFSFISNLALFVSAIDIGKQACEWYILVWGLYPGSWVLSWIKGPVLVRESYPGWISTVVNIYC